MGGSDDGYAHTSIDISADFGVGFLLPLPLGEPGRDSSFFSKKILASLPRGDQPIRRNHERIKKPTLLEATSPKIFLLLLTFMSC
jgi:hypothetical protein